MPGPVLDERRDHQLTAGLVALDHERRQVGARRVDRCREPRGAGADDQNLPPCAHERCFSIIDASCSRVTFPTIWSTTCPDLNTSKVGMPRTEYCIGVRGFSSTFILPITARPSKSAASASTVGAMRRHGMHHSAQKSTTTGWLACSTVSPKLPSVMT